MLACELISFISLRKEKKIDTKTNRQASLKKLFPVCSLKVFLMSIIQARCFGLWLQSSFQLVQKWNPTTNDELLLAGDSSYGCRCIKKLL
jgi:hypothetical protein